MTDRTKKILLIVTLIAVTFLLGFILFLFATNSPLPGRLLGITPATSTPGQLPSSTPRTATSTISTQPGQTNQLPPPNNTTPNSSYYQPQAVTRLNTSAVSFPSDTSNSGGLRYYNIGDGKFYQIASDGSEKTLSDQIFFNVSNVVWAENRNKAILEYPDKTKIVYNFETKKQVTLPKHWEDFSFSPDSTEIVAKSMTLSPENRVLVIAKDDGSGDRAIQELGNNADRVTVDWSPSRQTVAFSQTGDPIGGERRQILLIGQNQENFKPITIEGSNFESQWSPSGQHLLYSVDSSRSDYKPELWVTESYGDKIDTNRRSLQINTWAKKCTFGDETTLYCAVPRFLPQGAGILPDALDTTVDDLYRIDLKTGARITIPLDTQNRSISSMTYDKTGNKLFFTDNSELGVFEVKL